MSRGRLIETSGTLQSAISCRRWAWPQLSLLWWTSFLHIVAWTLYFGLVPRAMGWGEFSHFSMGKERVLPIFQPGSLFMIILKSKHGPLSGCGMAEDRFEIHFIRCPVLTKVKASTEHTTLPFRLSYWLGIFCAPSRWVDTSRFLKILSLKDRIVKLKKKKKAQD